MQTRNQAVFTLRPSESGFLTLSASALAQGLVLPGAGPIDPPTAGASTAARYHSSARASDSSWPPARRAREVHCDP
jgi:hypothetical protein